MFGKEPTPEEEKERIQKVLKLITKYDAESPTVILLEAIKPLVYIGGELGRFFLAPILVLLWPEGFTYINTFEQRKNINELLKKIEETSEKRKEKEKKNLKMKKTKKGWRRFLHL